jgi:hypothetical protein
MALADSGAMPIHLVTNAAFPAARSAARVRAFRRLLLLTALGSISACAISACGRRPNAAEEEARARTSPAQQAAEETRPLEKRLNTSTPAQVPRSTGAGPENLQAFNAQVPAPGAPGERPSVSQNMGRGFQGSLLLRVRDGSRTHELRYLSLGDRARIQIDARTSGGAQAPLHFDAVLEGDNILIFDHAKRTIRTISLAQIKPRPGSDASAAVHVKKTGESVTLGGVPCEPYQIEQPDLRVTACVSALPGSFDIGKFETVSGIQAPAWVEALLNQQQFPLRAQVTDPKGHDRYSLELVEYSPGPVNTALLTVPADYQRL